MKLRDLDRIIFDFVCDYYDLLKSGLFMHSAYSRRYLKTGALKFLALFHYLLIGEKRGYWPNPFFDPAYFAKRAGTCRLVEYYWRTPLWIHPTSPFFDSRWYLKSYTAELATNENPLQHFCLTGFDKGYNPTPRFDMAFFRRAIARDHKDRRKYAYEYFCDADPAAPLNCAELEERQKLFYAQIKLETLKRAEAPQKRFLVFVQAGQNFAPPYDPATAPFDLLINYYDASDHLGDAQYVFRQRGTKTTAIRKLLEDCPEVLLGYEAVLFLDDDVELTQEQIAALFKAQEIYRLDLLQASVSEDSECFFPVLKQPEAGKGLRLISGIEIMMPIVSHRALQDCGFVFAETVSGWGVDTLLSAEVLKRYGKTIGLLGDVIAIHERPTDVVENSFYKFLTRNGIDPTVEAGRIAMKFGLNDKMSAIEFLAPDEAAVAHGATSPALL